MTDHSPRFPGPSAWALALGFAFAVAASSAPPAHAASALTARPALRYMRAAEGASLAQSLARRWQGDAELLYVESADSLAPDGTAKAWSYLYGSATGRQARGFTITLAGNAAEFALASPFETRPLESGWQDATSALAAAEKDAAPDAERVPLHAVLSCGLVPIGAADARPVPRTTWLIVYGDARGTPAEEIVLDALKGNLLARRAATAPETGTALASSGLPPYFAAHQGAFLVRAAAMSGDPAKADAERARWLTAREGAALARLAAQDAMLDTLGNGEIAASGADVERALAALTRWRSAGARNDSVLALSSARIAGAAKDLAADRPTEFAVYLTLEGRARPARVSIFVDNAEVARVAYGEAEWRALDAGGWAEVVRATARAGAHDVRAEIEGADHRTTSALWHGTFVDGRVGLMRLRVAGTDKAGAPPKLELLAGSTP